MTISSSLMHTVLNRVAPARTRRRSRTTETSTASESPLGLQPAPRSHKETAAQLQAAHAARRADEMRSAF